MARLFRHTALLPMTFIGIDCGTSALKAVLVDDRQALLAVDFFDALENGFHNDWRETHRRLVHKQ